MYINKVTVLGNLTRDPEVKALPSGVQVANISIATNRVWKDKNGAKQEDAEFHNIVIFGRMAEIAGEYLFKGSQCLIDGRLQTRSWENDQGKTQYRTEIICENLTLGNRPNNGDENQTRQPSRPARRQAPQKKSRQSNEDVDTIEYPDEEVNPEDIPF